MYSVYLIRNLVTGREYIGSTSKTLGVRLEFMRHKAEGMLRQDNDIYEDIRNLGIQNFSIELLAPCSSKEEALDEEEFLTEYFLDKGHDLYNIKIANKHSDETKYKMHLTRSQGMYLGENNPAYGRPSAKRRPIICVETGKYYEHLNLFVEDTGISRSTAKRMLANPSKTNRFNDLHIRYATEDETRIHQNDY